MKQLIIILLFITSPIYAENVIILNNYDKSKILDYKTKQLEEQRIKKSTKGGVGVGLYANDKLGALSIKLNPLWRLGAQVVTSYEDKETSLNECYQGRVYMNLFHTLLGVDQLAVMYVGVGGGVNRQNSEIVATGALSANQYYESTFKEAFIGIEFNALSNIYWFTELSLQDFEEQAQSFGGASTNDKGISTKAAFGVHLYFN